MLFYDYQLLQLFPILGFACSVWGKKLLRNGDSEQMTVHALIADFPVSNVKDLDLNQGNPPPHSSKHLCDIKSFWHYVVSLTFDDGISAIYLLPPCVVVVFLYLCTILIAENNGPIVILTQCGSFKKRRFSIAL